MWTSTERVNPIEIPITLDNMKEHLRVTSPDEDNMIDAFVRAAAEQIETEAGISLAEQQWTWKFDCFSGADLVIPRGPLKQVDSIAYIDEDSNLQTWAANNYEVDTVHGRVRPVSGVAWPNTDQVYNAVTITFTAGWANTAIPHPLRAAVRLLAAHLYLNREAVQEIAAGMIEIPVGITALITPYKRGLFGA